MPATKSDRKHAAPIAADPSSSGDAAVWEPQDAARQTSIDKPVISRPAGLGQTGQHRSGIGSDGNLKQRRISRWLVWGLIGAFLGIAVSIVWFIGSGKGAGTAEGSDDPNFQIPLGYDADRAMGYLIELCDLGPRPSGSAAMIKQQDLLQQFFQQRGGTVRRQSFEIRHPETGQTVELSNLIASWGVDRPRRFLLCAHYDTRPFPDQDRANPRGIFVGANDGASGTAALMEWSHQFESLPADVGVDVVLFDAEEFIFERQRDDYFLGSTYFAENYRRNPPPIAYTGGILLDMVGDRELKLYYERNSLRYAPELARSVWSVADGLGARAFIPRARHEVLDDHLALNQIAGIPTIDLIDFDYPRPGLGQPSYWHTTQDVPSNCSGRSLATVVYVLDTWIRTQSRE